MEFIHMIETGVEKSRRLKDNGSHNNSPLCGNGNFHYKGTFTMSAVTCPECLKRMKPEMIHCFLNPFTSERETVYYSHKDKVFMINETREKTFFNCLASHLKSYEKAKDLFERIDTTLMTQEKSRIIK